MEQELWGMLFANQGPDALRGIGIHTTTVSIPGPQVGTAEGKEKAITELLATAGNRLDAIVQCGTNMSLNAVLERLEPVVGIPIIGVNAAILWYALRENGFQGPLKGGGRLLREF
jgi:maleate cis-trans isomerase